MIQCKSGLRAQDLCVRRAGVKYTLFYNKNPLNLAEPEAVLILAHTFS